MAGRGRLSSLDLLPEEARDDLIWAIGELKKRERPQADIHFEFNDRLEARASRRFASAFNRRPCVWRSGRCSLKNVAISMPASPSA